MEDSSTYTKRLRLLVMAGVCGVAALSQVAMPDQCWSQRPLRLPASTPMVVEQLSAPRRTVSDISGVPFPRSLREYGAVIPTEVDTDPSDRLRSIAADQGLWPKPLSADPPAAEYFLPPERNGQIGGTGQSRSAHPGSIVSLGTPTPGVQNNNFTSPPRPKARVVRVASTTLTGQLHSAQLETIASEALRTATDSLRKRSLYTARKSAFEAIHSVVASRDIGANSNRYSNRLQTALDAIREAKDFCGQFGMVDNESVQRMVDSHSTNVLRDQDLSSVAAVKAVEAYLTVAKNNLVAASGSSIEASESLRLLGRIQSTFNDDTSIYNKAVALTWLQAAAEARPSNAAAHRDLGQTLLSQGLSEQAASSLRKSIRLAPTRSAVQQLMIASQQSGDARSVQLCQLTLQSDRLPSDFPIVHLTPEQFAMTSQKQGAAPQSLDAHSRVANKPVVTDASNPSPNPANGAKQKNWFQFWRR
ncbi:MAG: tetratricopeptide repeat protein [Rubripirellula sp.]